MNHNLKISVSMHSVHNISILFYFLHFRHRKRIQNRRPSSHKRPKRRRKEVVAAKPRRRSGQKEKSVTSWTIKYCSISQPTRNCTRKSHNTNWSLQVLYLNDWRFVVHLHDVPLSNCVKKVSFNDAILYFYRQNFRCFAIIAIFKFNTNDFVSHR